VNTIVRGSVADVEASRSNGHCAASASNFRPALSPGLVSGAGNQAAEPLFVDAAAGDYRPAAGSPTIDAGVTDALLGTADPAGCPRSLGLAPDIGAYEHADPLTDACATAPAETAAPPAPTADDPASQDADQVRGDAPAPVMGRNVVVAPGRGMLRVRRPGSKRFRTLAGPARIPVGSIVDARAGRARLVSAIDAGGRLQVGTFWGARFEVRQRRTGTGMTSLVLRGSELLGCRATASRSVATASRKRKHRRNLWASDSGGRFSTHGANSVATARGTAWLTEDTCAGTRTRVTEGAVAVHDRVRHRTVLVKAGQSYLARTRR
jgi:hypothetical protein